MSERTGGPVLIGYAAISTQGKDLDQQCATLQCPREKCALAVKTGGLERYLLPRILTIWQ